MNSSPFSLQTIFRPEDAGEDKIDLELGGWEVHGLQPFGTTPHAFKQFMASPQSGSEDMAWSVDDEAPIHGWFFLRPALKGKDRDKLLIRRQSLSYKKNDLRHEAPLCGGHCLFYQDKKPHPETGNTVHRAKLRLALNMQRFIRHQPPNDTHALVCKPRLQRRREDRSTHGEEFAFDGEDNWLPDSVAWQKLGSSDKHSTTCLNLIVDQLEEDLTRACKTQSILESSPGCSYTVEMNRNGKFCKLSTVETVWEFPSDNPIAEVLQMGAKMMHLKRNGAVTKIKRLDFKEANRVLNSPCFIIPVAEDVKLKLYAKTNCRIRFEIVQSRLGKQTSKLLEEANNQGDPWDTASNSMESLFTAPNQSLSQEKLPIVLRALRKRAAVCMNQVMTEMQKGRATHVKACSVVELLAEVAVAVPAGFGSKAKRLSQIQTILFFLCYQRGFRGNLKQGAYAAALATLQSAGVLEFDRSRQFYTLSDSYIQAADALISATGEPILSVFGMNWESYKVKKGGKMPQRLRE